MSPLRALSACVLLPDNLQPASVVTGRFLYQHGRAVDGGGCCAVPKLTGPPLQPHATMVMLLLELARSPCVALCSYPNISFAKAMTLGP